MENNNEFNEKDLNDILIEDNILQNIYFPNLNEIGNKFKGRIINGKLQKGVYTWKNGQVYYGGFSSNNKFNGRGKIIFPNKDELAGSFNAENYTIEKAIYKTSNREYQGSFKNNKLHGKFRIKNAKDKPHYLFSGYYFNGKKNGRFILEKVYKHTKIKVTGIFNNGRKNGQFSIYSLDHDNKLMFNKKYVNNCDYDSLIEKRNYFQDKIEHKILCMLLFEEKDKLYLLIGSNENLLIYRILEQKDIILKKKILLFENEEINDILKLKEDNKILLCSSKGNLKLIELFLEQKQITMSTDNTNEKDYKIFQDFKGLKNSKSIFRLIELSNGLIASGDCENLIIWKKKYIKKEQYDDDDNNKQSNNSFFEIFNGLLSKRKNAEGKNNSSSSLNYDFGNNSLIRDFYEYELIDNKAYSHTYCILEIKNENNNVTLAVAQPDSRSVNFIEISKEGKIEEKKTIKNIYSIPNRKKIMTIFNNNDNKYLIIGCKNNIINIIDLNNYDNKYEIYGESITSINPLKDYLLFGIKKEKKSNEYEGYLIQKKLEFTNKENNYINFISISELNKIKNDGNIIDTNIYIFNNEEIIVTIGTDNKIIIIY